MRKLFVFVFTAFLVFLSFLSDSKNERKEYIKYDQKNIYSEPFSIKIKIKESMDLKVIKDRQKIFDGIVEKEKEINLKIKEFIILRTNDFDEISIYWLDANQNWQHVVTPEYPFRLTLTRSGGKIISFIDKGSIQE
tara:strand:+ start:2495 stop:2902 length:408 start_codon:yes stop_codon:yes gene_type:complete